MFYKGFTREFLKGNVGSSADLLRDAREAVEQIGRGKKVRVREGVIGWVGWEGGSMDVYIHRTCTPPPTKPPTCPTKKKQTQLVMVDGVGYPAVGSICGVSNADLAQALGPKVPILIVGRPGVGDAVDSFNLNATFFRARGLRVLGGVFNRLPVEGFYSLEACKEVRVVGGWGGGGWVWFCGGVVGGWMLWVCRAQRSTAIQNGPPTYPNPPPTYKRV